MSSALATGGDVAVVIAATAEAYGLTPRQVLSRSVSREVLDARTMAMHVARRLTKQSLPAIGKRFRRDHTTVLAADRRVAELAASQEQVRAKLDQIADAVRIGQVNAATVAAARRALGEPELAARPPAPAMRQEIVAAIAAARVWRHADAAVAAWAALAQAQFTPAERPARRRFDAAMKALEASLKRRA